MLRWTTQLLPPELMGSHIASGRSHTTGRMHDLSFRAATAVFGHLGIEWDLARANEDELAELTQWIAFYKEHRALLLGGDLVRLDFPDPAVLLHGVVAPDRSAAIYAFVALAVSDVVQIGRLPLPGPGSGSALSRSAGSDRPATPGPVPASLVGRPAAGPRARERRPTTTLGGPGRTSPGRCGAVRRRARAVRPDGPGRSIRSKPCCWRPAPSQARRRSGRPSGRARSSGECRRVTQVGVSGRVGRRRGRRPGRGPAGGGGSGSPGRRGRGRACPARRCRSPVLGVELVVPGAAGRGRSGDVPRTPTRSGRASAKRGSPVRWCSAAAAAKPSARTQCIRSRTTGCPDPVGGVDEAVGAVDGPAVGRRPIEQGRSTPEPASPARRRRARPPGAAAAATTPGRGRPSPRTAGTGRPAGRRCAPAAVASRRRSAPGSASAAARRTRAPPGRTMPSARSRSVSSPVASAAASSASTACMLPFSPRYGSSRVKPRSQASTNRPASASKNRSSQTASASSSRSSAPGSAASRAEQAASTTKAWV